MAFDYGTRRIGVAVGHPRIGRGRGIGVVQVRNGQADLASMKKLVEEWKPEGFVLGMPRMNSQAPSALKKQILKFGEILKKEFGLPLWYVDETLSTEESNFRLKHAGEHVSRNKMTDERNKVSAEIILETYFSQISV